MNGAIIQPVIPVLYVIRNHGIEGQIEPYSYTDPPSLGGVARREGHTTTFFTQNFTKTKERP